MIQACSKSSTFLHTQKNYHKSKTSYIWSHLGGCYYPFIKEREERDSLDITKFWPKHIGSCGFIRQWKWWRKIMGDAKKQILIRIVFSWNIQRRQTHCWLDICFTKYSWLSIDLESGNCSLMIICWKRYHQRWR